MTKQDFLFELGCEELPPKALAKLGSALLDNISASFESLSLSYETCQWFATPRRLAVLFTQLDAAQADKQVEKLGPAVQAAFDDEGNPRPAALGFAKSNGVGLEQLSRKQTDKGERLAYVAEVKGETTASLIQSVLDKAISQLPIPKAMRWGNSTAQFTRPVHWVVTMFGEEVLPVKLFEIVANNQTQGHRFHQNEPVTLAKASDYASALLEAKVIVSFEERQSKIRSQVEAIAQSLNATAVIDDGLLAEVAALVEWPVALAGNFDEAFLTVPAEALISSMAEHQKYFHLVDNKGNLLPKFITVANIESKRPESVIEGNEKVIRPRLADAKFFFDTDKKQSLDSHIEHLKSVLFQKQLGTLFDKSSRVKQLAQAIASKLDWDKSLVSRAAEIYKCDLMTNMVYEFPDLQGIMGRYYATNDNEPMEVACAMDEVYMPRFAGDNLPTTNTGLVLAIAERMDTLVGIFGINQLPTGAKDPFALRRASLGVLRLIAEKQLLLDIEWLIEQSMSTFGSIEIAAECKENLLQFFAARELAMYQAEQLPTQAIKSVQAINITQPYDFSKRVKAVTRFMASEESSDLAEANKRVKNILEKSNFQTSEHKIDPSIFEADEKQLYTLIQQAKEFVISKTQNGDYEAALDRLAELKPAVNQFFDNVMINAEDELVRQNRFSLISELRNLFLEIADISLLQK